jgi:hypothetical protein
VKVGHCQALMPKTPNQKWLGVFLCALKMMQSDHAIQSQAAT